MTPYNDVKPGTLSVCAVLLNPDLIKKIVSHLGGNSKRWVLLIWNFYIVKGSIKLSDLRIEGGLSGMEQREDEHGMLTLLVRDPDGRWKDSFHEIMFFWAALYVAHHPILRLDPVLHFKRGSGGFSLTATRKSPRLLGLSDFEGLLKERGMAWSKWGRGSRALVGHVVVAMIMVPVSGVTLFIFLPLSGYNFACYAFGAITALSASTALILASGSGVRCCIFGKEWLVVKKNLRKRAKKFAPLSFGELVDMTQRPEVCSTSELLCFFEGMPEQAAIVRKKLSAPKNLSAPINSFIERDRVSSSRDLSQHLLPSDSFCFC